MPPQNQPYEQQPSQGQPQYQTQIQPQYQPQDQYQPQEQFQPEEQFQGQGQFQGQQPQTQQFPPQPPRYQGQPQQMSRRSLMRGGLIGGALGVVIAGGAGAAVAITDNGPSLKPVSNPVAMAPMEPNATQGPLVVYISDPANGLLDVYGGTGATQVHNPGLVSQLLKNLK